MQKIDNLISEDITERISEKLNEIEKSSNLSNLDVSSIVDKITDFTTIEHVTIQNNLWKDIAKLSIDFYLDFDYYKQFTFQSKFSCKEYHDALKTLGFKEINGFWKSCSKPIKTLVINYVVQSCIYRTIMMKMNEGDSPDANLNEEFKDCCPFCDKNLNGVHNCESCNATAEEIENLRNQNKLIENKHNLLDNDESVAGSIGVVENDVLSSERVELVNSTPNSLINSDNNTNENTLIINENSKSISNINFSERNKQKINRGNEIGGENVDIERRFAIAKVASIGGNSNKMRSKHKKPNISSRNYTFNENVMKINNNNNINKHDQIAKIDENSNNKMIVGYVMIESIATSDAIKSDNNNDDVNKWECKCVNGEECLSCKPCHSPRLEIWSCKQCTADNQISEDYCVACGKENESKILKYCSECKHHEIVCDDLCGDCLQTRNETAWICWYRLCQNRNPGNVKYCKHCGLDRDARKIDIGAPMWRCTGDVPREIWICDKCSNFNDISDPYCRHYISQYRVCYNKTKYTQRCYKCHYKYNHENSKHCKMCKAKLGWTFI